jgi:hypothetical protein
MNVAGILISFKVLWLKNKAAVDFIYTLYRSWQDFLQCKQMEWFHEPNIKMKHAIFNEASLP